ncbi:alpha/beta hydrolase family protein [Specibacter cremeus]|uniref:alpha/beta hydrolase family protein n=1 Tax=Specibacter cremeus TaxID=1629051 RepID=UPI000F767118|nr:alpha/beta fold hydrolase [Specibacter cremeus]
METSAQRTGGWFKWTALATGAAAAGVAAVVTATSALAGYFARRVVIPEKLRLADVPVLAVIPDGPVLQIVLPATPDTTVAGTFALYFDNGRAHAVIGRILAYVPREGSVTREVLRVEGGDLRAATAGWWSGSIHAHPDELGLDSSEVTLNLPGGPAPAWFVPAPGALPTWAIMVHGRGGTRAEGLRAVQVAHRLGMNSLLISYRNDPEAHAAADGRYGLGLTEWEDVDVAIDHALAHGARDVVLIGYSMGGAICLQVADRGRNRGRVLALVLDAPVIDWVDVLAFQAKLNRIPERVGRYGQFMLSHPLGRRITGLAAPVDLKSTDWVSRAVELRTPTLAIHSVDDDFVPFGPTAELARRNPEMVTFEPFSKAGHAKEWNVEPERWERVVADWLRPRLGRYTLPREHTGG